MNFEKGTTKSQTGHQNFKKIILNKGHQVSKIKF